MEQFKHGSPKSSIDADGVLSWVDSRVVFWCLWGWCPILVHGTKIMRGKRMVLYYSFPANSQLSPTLQPGTMTNPGHGTKIMRGEEAGIYNVHSSIFTLLFYLWCSLFYLVPQEILVTAPKSWEGKGWYFIIVPANSQLSPTLQPGATTNPGHGTKIMRGEEAGIYNIHSSIFTLLFYLWCSLFYLVPQEILVTAPKSWEGKGWYFIIVPANSQLSPTLQPGATTNPGHGTKIMRGEEAGIYNVHSSIFTLLFYLWCSLFYLVPQEILVMATRNARGVPSTSLY